MKSKILLFCLLLGCAGLAAAEKTVIRLGVLPFGTVQWEIAAMQYAGLAKDKDFELDVHTLANPEANKIALQSGSVDMIVTDWIWVSRQRGSGADYTFYPYSSAAGALMVPADGPIKTVRDLNGKRLGIAGGELDKNWLLLQVLAQQEYQTDLNRSAEKLFAAPPLLNQQLEQGRVDAVLNYWHYAARLEADGYRQLIDGRGILQGLGIVGDMANLGYVFNAGWGEAHRFAVQQFFRTAAAGRDRLCSDDTAWAQIADLTQAKSSAAQAILRQRYCAGRVARWGETEIKAYARIYALLREVSGERLTGPAETIAAGTFWTVR
ncbi:MAG: ABC transporter substrate-binding protein [Gammaproteobacteria bacterium]